MLIKKILRVSLFSIDLIRLLLIALSLAIYMHMREGIDDFFPHLVYISSNALFPLISFFILLKPLENLNYLPLYIAGKTIAVILFYIWAVFSLSFNPVLIGMESYIMFLVIIGGAVFISLFDILTILGAFFLKRHGGA